MGDVATRGLGDTLRDRGLDHLVGKPLREVYTALFDQLAPDGGAEDDAIARNAIIDTIIEFDDAGLDATSLFTEDQMRELIATFVSRSVAGRILLDIGLRTIKVPDTPDAIRQVETELHGFIHGASRDACARLTFRQHVSTAALDAIVSRVYQDTFEILQVLAEEVAE